MITTVVFDLDDTLYSEMEYCRSGFGSVAQNLANLPGAPDAEHISECLWEQFTAGNRTKTFNTALEKLGMPYNNKIIHALVKIYRNHIPKIALPTESRKVIEQLSSEYTLALLTDGFLPAQQLKVQALGIEKYFKCIIYTEQLGRSCWKPSPAGFEKIMETLNAKPQTIAYVADNVQKDFVAPNKLGFLTIQIILPKRIHAESSAGPAAAAQQVIHKITQLPEFLAKL